MAPSPRIFLLVVLLAVIALATSNGIHGSAGFGFEAGVSNEQQSKNNDAHSGRFGFPYSGIIFRGGNKVDIESGVSAEHQSENKNDGHSESRFSYPGADGIFFRGGNNANSEADSIEHQIEPNELNQSSYNNTEGERKFRWPDSITVRFKRSNEQNSELGAATDYYIGQSGLNHEYHHHNHSAGNNDTDGERKFPRPSSISVSFKRSNEQNSESGAGTDYYIGQGGLNHENHHHNHSAGNNDTDGERKFPWPSSISVGFKRSKEQNSELGAGTDFYIGQSGLNHENHHHNHSAGNNDIDGERKFPWPSSFSVGFKRSKEQNSELGAGTDFYIGQSGLNHENHHHNHSAGNNDTDGERKFPWPSSISVGFKRSKEQNSELGAGTDFYIGQSGLNHENHHHNHSAGNNDIDGERKFPWPSSFSVGFKRSKEQNSELGAGTDFYIGQSGLNHENHHHNHSAGNNDTDGERKFRWPSSVPVGFARSNEQNSDEDDETKFFGLIPSLAPCNHTGQAGRSCYDCTHTLLCFANDIGIKRNCSPLYCNQGRCAVEPSVECSPSLGHLTL